ncbi:BadF/BadG/BcrA/BcrD ATPase family protein [Labrys wisconsinensis]|uniref:Glucosamine kinase n=1 Tax=Labrys wisconsinensis TaxID=425677 RepID=A0ABU0JDC4_9HYPH|nr:BadF/BadG/BcrA/BcrD ATPase family protein [Labrys wisconsinensis]MDQ0472287.1 glucosamine kinase [Labrys wisconsinensis]
MADALYLGLDGGGTNSRARLTDAAGLVLGEGVAGSSNLTLGVDVAATAIRAATAAALDAAGLDASALGRVRAGLGLAGANVPSLAAAIAAEPFGYAAVAVASDAVAACLGAHGGRDGAILILGTGSQGLALVQGRATAVGGWGFQIGDDGSGAILGRAAVRAAILSIDELAPRSALTRAVMARFHDDPSEAVIWAKSAVARDYARFAPLVFEHRAAGDAVAEALIDEAVAGVGAQLDRLMALGASRIVLVGGLAEPYRPWLPERFAPVLVAAEGDPMDGALALARREAA